MSKLYSLSVKGGRIVDVSVDSVDAWKGVVKSADPERSALIDSNGIWYKYVRGFGFFARRVVWQQEEKTELKVEWPSDEMAEFFGMEVPEEVKTTVKAVDRPEVKNG